MSHLTMRTHDLSALTLDTPAWKPLLQSIKSYVYTPQKLAFHEKCYMHTQRVRPLWPGLSSLAERWSSRKRYTGRSGVKIAARANHAYPTALL